MAKAIRLQAVDVELYPAAGRHKLRLVGEDGEAIDVDVAEPLRRKIITDLERDYEAEHNVEPAERDLDWNPELIG